ncbi:MAG: hypothetical protein HQ510_04740 [Candidatus Marinimicrobia bacterium]|nr:hypothetical protein [Candidatus Neomarinimicrobiota bacterium]
MNSGDDTIGFIGKIYLVVSENQEDIYKKIFRKEINSGRILLCFQKKYDEQGIFLVSDKVARDNGLDYEPYYMVFLGDTLYQDGFLNGLVEKTLSIHKENKSKSWVVVGTVENILDDNLPPFEDDLEKNRWGYYHINKTPQSLVSSDEKYYNFSNTDIVDIQNSPSYTELIDFNGATSSIIDTGVMVISHKACRNLRGLRSRDPHGLFSMINALRTAYIEDKIEIYGLVATSGNDWKSKDWVEMNYPWEYLGTNSILSNRLVADTINNPEVDSPDLINSDYKVFTGEALINHFGKLSSPSKFIEDTNGKDSITNHGLENSVKWGIHPDAKIEGFVIAPKSGKLFIGANTIIDGCCVLKSGCRIMEHSHVIDSIIGENVFIDTFTLVDHSIIMRNTKIYTHGIIPYSVIGEACVLGSRNTIACQTIRGPEYSMKTNKAYGEFFSNTRVIKYFDHFGAIIGDGTKVGMNVTVQPGRKIGSNCIIYPGTEIRRNYSKNSSISRDQ